MVVVVMVGFRSVGLCVYVCVWMVGCGLICCGGGVFS